MATNFISPQFAYGIGDNLIQLAPKPIIARRAPGTRDLAQIGTTWINTVTSTVYVLASIAFNTATWTTAPGSGATILASLAITGVAGLDVQNAASTTTISSSLINFDNAAGLTTISGNLTVAGTTTITGDLDLSSTALIDLTSTLNAAPSIYLHANGGVAEQIRIHADQGTSANSIELDSDLGGITLVSGLASADSINFTSTAGGIDMDAGGEINIASSEASTTAISIIASEATVGGILIQAFGTGGGANGIALQSAESLILLASKNSTITVSDAGEDLELTSTLGKVVLDGGEAAADAITLTASDVAGGIDVNAGTGGVTVDTTGAFSVDGVAASNVTVTGAAADLTLSAVGGSVVMTGSQAAVDAITISATDAAGGIDINAGTGGVTVDTTAGFSIDGATASNVTVTGAAADLTLSTTGGSVNITASEAAVDAIVISATDAAGGIDVNVGTGGITIDTTAAFSIDGVTASNVTVTGAAADLTLSTVGGSVNITASEAVVDAIKLTASNAAGGVQLIANGLVSVTPATDSQASPSAASTKNFRVLTITFTGFTTAMGASQAFTITSSAILATSGILVNVASLNASTNGAIMTLDGTIQAIGSVVVNTTNNGAGALGAGDNVVVTLWIIS